MLHGDIVDTYDVTVIATPASLNVAAIRSSNGKYVGVRRHDDSNINTLSTPIAKHN